MANIARMGRSIVLALSLLALPTGAINAANAAPTGAWTKVATNPQTKLAYYIDRATLKKQPGFSYFWIYVNSSTGQALGVEKKVPIYGVAAYISADCRKANLRIRSMELINQQGKQIDTDNRGDRGPLLQFDQQKPVGRAVLKYVCPR